MSNTGHKSITRFDRPGKHGGHGFAVHFYWRGKRVYRRFHDGTWDGPEKALTAAIRHRDLMERRLKKPRSERWLRSVGTLKNGRRWRRMGAYIVLQPWG